MTFVPHAVREMLGNLWGTKTRSARDLKLRQPAIRVLWPYTSP